MIRSRQRPVLKAIANAEGLLPGTPAPDGTMDLRWQSIIQLTDFIETDPIPLWEFALKWGKHPQSDVRMAIATCLLEHLLEHHAAMLRPRAMRAAAKSARFARTLKSCWPNVR